MKIGKGLGRISRGLVETAKTGLMVSLVMGAYGDISSHYSEDRLELVQEISIATNANLDASISKYQEQLDLDKKFYSVGVTGFVGSLGLLSGAYLFGLFGTLTGGVESRRREEYDDFSS